jgi:hypothetical protein
VLHLPPLVSFMIRVWVHASTRVASQSARTARRKGTQAKCVHGTRSTLAGNRIQHWAPEPRRVPVPLSRLPWDLAKDELGPKGSDLLEVMRARWFAPRIQLILRKLPAEFRSFDKRPDADADAVCSILKRDTRKRVCSWNFTNWIGVGSSCDAPLGGLRQRRLLAPLVCRLNQTPMVLNCRRRPT